MKFCIITHVQHIKKDNKYYAYAPYVREMNIWLQNVDNVIIVAPLVSKEIATIDLAYEKEKIAFQPVSEFDVVSLKNSLKSIIVIPKILFTIFKAMKSADRIHLRCPGNMGLLACFIQILFPEKQKTAKYAGNWDPKSKQPWSYRLQKWILSNTFLTRNMQVLVYGDWPNQTKNIKSFFTATYNENEIRENSVIAKSRTPITQISLPTKFLFVGTLSEGKQPLYAIKLIESLIGMDKKVILELYGDGVLRNDLEQYVHEKKMEKSVVFRGNQTKETLKQAYQNFHFLILPSKSEGWPKAVAEAMFWGCIPVTTPVSCVPYMLADGKRGILLQENLEKDAQTVLGFIEMSDEKLDKMSKEAQKWSQQFTIEKFEKEIKKLIVSNKKQ